MTNASNEPFQLKGYGKTRAEARDDAEKRLPYPINDITKYRSIIQGYPVQLEDETWEFPVSYALKEN